MSLTAPVVRGEVHYAGDEITIVVECARLNSSWFEVVTLCSSEGEDYLAFVHQNSLDNASHLRTVNGDLVGFGVYENFNLPHVWNWRSKGTKRILQCRSRPETQGGAMAMAISGALVVVAYRRKICIYEMNVADPQLLHVFRPHFSSEFASVRVHRHAAGGGDTVFVLALSIRQWTHVYHIRQDLLRDVIDVRLVWQHLVPSGTPRDVHHPQLSETGKVLTWIAIPPDELSLGTSFCLAVLPSPAARHCVVEQAVAVDGTTKFYESQDPHLPALYWRPTYDFDELRGLAVFGNVFGELIVFDFSKTPLPLLGQCFAKPDIAMIQHEPMKCDSVDLEFEPSFDITTTPLQLMTTPLQADDDGSVSIFTQEMRKLFQERLEEGQEMFPELKLLPSDWTASAFYSDLHILTWNLDSRTLYGKVIPLIRHSELCFDIVYVGGLIVVVDSDPESLEEHRAAVFLSNSIDDIISYLKEPARIARCVDAFKPPPQAPSGKHMARRTAIHTVARRYNSGLECFLAEGRRGEGKSLNHSSEMSAQITKITAA
ncbi:hypothetical protein EIP91_005076 [Steccherinum ochraceum]|uniref:Uncharacterized protein n=1 Tax=Steccherinum ochraceum TaxID=92696 RepID=A0A4R0RDU6_9APHY|nr:hypothetical protein EIP91_005076 [Steccherinum ochraceum]